MRKRAPLPAAGRRTPVNVAATGLRIVEELDADTHAALVKAADQLELRAEDVIAAYLAGAGR